MFTARAITHGNLLRILLTGFALVIVLLLAAGFIGIRNIRSIQSNVARLVERQLVTNRLIEELKRQQVSLSEVFSILARDPDSVDADRIQAQLDEADRNIARIADAGLATPERALWQRLKEASQGFSEETRRLLSEDAPETYASRELFRRHERFIAVVARLIEADYQNVLASQAEIDRRTEGLLRESVLLIGGCLIMALLSTALTVRLTTRLVRAMEAQATELSRVSWHMLENQEAVARRFSHELHDELGQALTAVKANLAAMQASADPARLEDCLRLVDEAIGNVRQMSQLLRPTILDDFGLEASLRWLAEGFTHRTGIEVDFRSSLAGARLNDETETHLFRIAQEALTNVARHSGAHHVNMELKARDGEIRLLVGDDGRGLSVPAAARSGMGMIGMRARARSAGGDLTVRSENGRGAVIEARVPARGASHEG